MDANDKKGGDTNLQKFLNKHDLMDAHEQLHHHCTPPNTHQQGQEQIDYVFITPALAPALLSAGFLQFNVPFISDHCTLHVDFDADILFNGEMPNVLEPNARNLVESNPAAQEKYVSTLEQSFINSRIRERVKKLEHDLK